MKSKVKILVDGHYSLCYVLLLFASDARLLFIGFLFMAKNYIHSCADWIMLELLFLSLDHVILLIITFIIVKNVSKYNQYNVIYTKLYNYFQFF